MRSLLVFLVGLLGVQCKAAKILGFFPIPSKSHQAVFSPIAHELARRGHEVTFYTSIPTTNHPPNYKEIIFPDIMALAQENSHDFQSPMYWIPVGLQVFFLSFLGLEFQKTVAQLDVVQDLIKSNAEFDLVMGEMSFIQESFSVLQHRFNAIPVEITSLTASTYLFNVNGIPYNPSYMSDERSHSSDKMSFTERLSNTYDVLSTLAVSYLFRPFNQYIADTYLTYNGWEGRPSLGELLSNKSLILRNSFIGMDAIPTTPNVVNIGGIHLKEPKPLPKDIQKLMDDTPEGVIYFSFGSLINMTSVAKGEFFSSFANSFAKLKQKILWKWESDEMVGKPDNVIISKWFPQADILRHKNCKLFITHGGYLSLLESISAGVPLVGIPFFGDQPKNLKRVVDDGMGLILDFYKVSEESVTKTLNEILHNATFLESAQKKRNILLDRRETPLDNAVYWIEYVLRHNGAPHLRSPLVSLSWWQSSLLDVFLILGLITLISLLILRASFKIIINKFCRKNECLEKKTN